ncbi:MULTISPECIES: retron St85 family RNA-directed DNA polymerase [Vibrio]|uniref:retron St85 family RNA-directed DNA polymerase n=1 Tax=Vibrio TaxID=662 RepID=UPI000C83DB2C|nr:retron St85 family RNA-directed DNA polymerase [Vibrio splendidus]PMM14112.1 RNA-dependent DNA polymerase [Vibrio splendidus]PMN27451.1 RNA-dependent DNA polymerase [Vibrio splendidus]PTO81255.1 RNA-directed DNA polymerase [Vibrio splendidus]
MTIRLYRAFEEDFGITRARLTTFAKTAPKKYKVYTIPKRSSGYRVIAHPSKSLKEKQKFLVAFLSDFFVSHSNSFAYKKGVGIKDNARMHLGTKYLLKMDFSDFFNSITVDLLALACDENGIKVSSAELKLLESLLFWNKTKTIRGSQNLVLSVGAPTSPLVSNFVMYKFDTLMSDYCSQNEINYSRYADDITFSTNKKNHLFQVTRVVKDILSDHYSNKITVNNIKTVFSSKAHNRHVTGITITNNNKLSVGRERKRLISTLIHKYTIGSIDIDDTVYLQGLLSFAIHVEPDFRVKMSNKYGFEVINTILKLRVENDK